MHPPTTSAVALPMLRESIATCEDCFTPQGRCRHHEDAVGGYGKGRVVLIGINPQGREDDPVYGVVEALDWRERNLLGDRILDLFVAERRIYARTNARSAAWRKELRQTVVELFPDSPGLQAVPFERHKGLRTWFACVAGRLGCGPEALRDHVTMVEAIKHTTAGVPELNNLRALHDGRDLLAQCKRWLDQQLVHLEPRGVIFTGNNGVRLARDLGAIGSEDQRTISELHGDVVEWRAPRWTRTIEVLFCYAFSGQTTSAWNHDRTGSRRVREWFANQVRPSCAGP
jgi:uracil-DNA glycosylase